MNPKALIESGILVNYCLGFCTPEEIKEVETHAAEYPEISLEIELIHKKFEEELLMNAIQPSGAVKVSVMRSVYREHALTDNAFPPLIDENSAAALKNWVAINNILPPVAEFDNLFISEVPSTEHVINFIAAAKQGHETEIHDDFIEYLYVISGTCTMDFEGVKKSYMAGDIISIPPNLHHAATVTSKEPMLALVQRQKI